MSDDDDITSRYHGGNPESQQAKLLSLSNTQRDRQRIVRLAFTRGAYGITCDEAERLLGLSHQTCSARFSELKRDRVLLPTDVRRQTRNNAPARVMRLAEGNRV